MRGKGLLKDPERHIGRPAVSHVRCEARCPQAAKAVALLLIGLLPAAPKAATRKE